MGQKLVKSNDIDIQINDHHIDDINSTIIENTNNGLHHDNNHISPNHIKINNNFLMKTKLNHHDSALSNDSGCYSNADSVDRYSSPSGSSVLCLFEQQQQQQQQQLQQQQQSQLQTQIENNEKKVKQQDSEINQQQVQNQETFNEQSKSLFNAKSRSVQSPFFKQKFFKFSDKKSNDATNNDTNGTNEAKNLLLLKQSLSSLNLADNLLVTTNDEQKFSLNSDSLKYKVDILYKQINHILSIKSKLNSNNSRQNETTKNEKTTSNHLNEINLNKKISKLNKSKKLKTVNNYYHNNNNNNYHHHHNRHDKNNNENSNKLGSPVKKNKTNSINLTRSYTYNTNLKGETDNNSKQIQSHGKNLLKSSRRFFIWKKSSNEDENQNYDEENNGITPKLKNKFFKFRNLSSNSQNQKSNNNAKKNFENNFSILTSVNEAKLNIHNNTVNMIAAKVLSESIDLTAYPYTDEFGFCTIPPALIRRYSYELKQPIEAIAKSLELERLNQLEQIGKLGIPNDFLCDSCKCLRTLKNQIEEAFMYKKCDLNTKNVELFLISLGLPMYIDSLTTSINNNNSNSYHATPFKIKTLCESITNEQLHKYGVTNQLHRSVILSAIEDLKLIF